MNTNPLPKIEFQRCVPWVKSRQRETKGFALVVTLILMVLLSILALGLLSLANIELRNTGERERTGLARQNALLALQLAIGELQENLGPDRRTSANAELISPSFEDANPYWVGAWNTEGGFRGWLVSGNENIIQPANPAADVSASGVRFTPGMQATASSSQSTGYSIGAAPAVVLVGDNTLGKTASAAEKQKLRVFAPVIDLKSAASGETTGRYAWWAGDEGVKANLAANVADLPSSASGGSGIAEELKFLASSPNRGFPTLGSDWSSWLPGVAGAPDFKTMGGKVISHNQVSLASPAVADESKRSFHDFTVSSAGVLSDSRRGGLKKDLSIAFEIPETSFRNSEFARVLTEGDTPNAYATNHQGSGQFPRVTGALQGLSTKTAVNYRDDSWPSGYAFRGPTFDQLRDHYQLYRRIDNPLSASASISAQPFLPNAQTTTGGNQKNRGPSGDYFGETNGFPLRNNPEVTDVYPDSGTNFVRLRPMANEFVPELIRYTYTLAIQSFKDPADPTKYQFRAIYTPFFILQNPYNVAINSPAIWIKVQRAELNLRIEYTDTSGKLISTNQFPSYPQNPNADVNLRSMNEEYYKDSSNSPDHDSIDYLLSDSGSANGTVRMKPGESKLFTIRGSTTLPSSEFFKNGKSRTIFMQSDLNDLFSTGIYMTVKARTGYFSNVTYTIPKGTNFTASINNKIEGRGTKDNQPELGWNAPEYQTIWTKLVAPGVTEPLPNGAHSDWNQSRFMQFYTNDYWTGGVLNQVSTALKPEDLEAVPSGPRRYIGRIDIYLKPTSDGAGRDNNISLATHNPRAMVQSSTMSGAQGPASVRGPATWTGSVTPLNPATASTPGFENRFWGSGTTAGDGGQRTLMLYDIPRAPITSIASFQNANVSRLGINPAFAIGNSYASPYIQPNQLWWRSSTSPPSYGNNNNYWIIDNSYVFNEDLFDSFFLSGVNPGSGSGGWNNKLPDAAVMLGGADPTNPSQIQQSIDDWKAGITPLLNPRLKFVMPSGRSTADAEKELDVVKGYSSIQASLSAPTDIRPHNAMAAYLLSQGTFNVNSSSVNAWRVQLAGLRGAAVNHFNSPVSISSDSVSSKTPFARSSMPGAGSSIGSDDELWNGFRSLTDSQIDDLAKEIVAEIKDRVRNRGSGAAARPFTTLGEFVNRRVGSSNAFSSKGALQAAIDRTINNTPSKLSGQPIIPTDKNHITERAAGISPESNTIPYQNPGALAETTIAGTPQWLMQADILENIGAQISARSDTFIIRTYGESVNPKTGKVDGRAWLEATVQREPSYMNPKDHPALPIDATSLSKESKEFGRRFTLVSLRWLTPDDI